MSSSNPPRHITTSKQVLFYTDKPNRVSGTVVRNTKSLLAAVQRANNNGPIKGEFGASNLLEIDPTKVSHEVTNLRAITAADGSVTVIGDVTFNGQQSVHALNAIYSSDGDTAFSIRTLGVDGKVNSGCDTKDILAFDLAVRFYGSVNK